MAVKHDDNLPSEQKPGRVTDCAIRNVHIDGVSCMAENAIGIIGEGSNIKEVTLRNIDYMRKPSDNIMLKGNTFDLAPSRIVADVPADCDLYISEGAEVSADVHIRKNI